MEAVFRLYTITPSLLTLFVIVVYENFNFLNYNIVDIIELIHLRKEIMKKKNFFNDASIREL